jgi:hypothetical protein
MSQQSDVRKQVERFYTASGIISLGHGGALIGKAVCKRTSATVAVKYIPITGKHSYIRRGNLKKTDFGEVLSLSSFHCEASYFCLGSLRFLLLLLLLVS